MLRGKTAAPAIPITSREITHPEIARQDMTEIAEDLKDIADVEVVPNMDGRTMLMVLAPNPKKKSSKEEPSRAQDQVPQSNS